MKPYDELTHRGKMRRMRRLAEAVLDKYGLADAPLRLFIDNGNIIYRVDVGQVPETTPANGANDLFYGNHCALRVHQPGYQTSEAIVSELAWLAALRREAGVPEPLCTLDGDLMTTVTVPTVKGPRNCSLPRWVQGRRFTKGVSPQHLRAQGRLMARLHTHAAGWTPSEGFTRPSYDWEGLFGVGTETRVPTPARYGSWCHSATTNPSLWRHTNSSR